MAVLWFNYFNASHRPSGTSPPTFPRNRPPVDEIWCWLLPMGCCTERAAMGRTSLHHIQALPVGSTVVIPIQPPANRKLSNLSSKQACFWWNFRGKCYRKIAHTHTCAGFVEDHTQLHLAPLLQNLENPMDNTCVALWLWIHYIHDHFLVATLWARSCRLKTAQLSCTIIYVTMMIYQSIMWFIHVIVWSLIMYLLNLVTWYPPIG